ncbi:MAG: hypothetical protein ABIU05_07330 [Nitrospirales bacterium]
MTIYDLRRTSASWLAISGENLAVIGGGLNHTSLCHTGIYARLTVAPIARALEENSARMLGIQQSAPPPMPSRIPDRRLRHPCPHAQDRHGSPGARVSGKNGRDREAREQ